ncbi:hypothetical protein C7M84_016233 [Penaeus vannamei]|uniref:Uncharacterized protein n=1 Tax=Penaeus vannamei TaxID=6689 RepID=A0A3R7SLF4_PENVA|nr:hypothetical protein C7M84_016233 [Penaeus vannamei]
MSGEESMESQRHQSFHSLTFTLSHLLISPPSRCSGITRRIRKTRSVVKVIKSVNKHEEDSGPSKSSSSSGGSQDDQPGSPEIAKFSALITRPPRSQQKKGESPPVVPILKIKEVQSAASKQKEAKETQPKAKEPKDVPPLKIKAPTPMPAKGLLHPRQPPRQRRQLPLPRCLRRRSHQEAKNSLDVALNPQVPAVPPPIMSPPIDTPKSSKKQEQSTGLLTETVGPIGHFVDDQGNEFGFVQHVASRTMVPP